MTAASATAAPTTAAPTTAAPTEAIAILSGDSLATTTRVEIETLQRAAIEHRRDMQTALGRAMSMATASTAIAEQCYYVLPTRGDDGQLIQGPSVRLAEICASAWGNLRFGSRVTEIGKTHLVAQGYCRDVESNNDVVSEVRRSIVGRKGRYSEAMIATTANAACSIALRNAVFRIVPGALVQTVYEQCVELVRTSGGDAHSKMLAWYQQHGASPEQVAALVGRSSVAALAPDDMATLRGIATWVRDGNGSMADALAGVSPYGAVRAREPGDDDGP